MDDDMINQLGSKFEDVASATRMINLWLAKELNVNFGGNNHKEADINALMGKMLKATEEMQSFYLLNFIYLYRIISNTTIQGIKSYLEKNI